MASGRVDILMYHSISDTLGPTSIPPDVFKAQMSALAESGVPVVTMDDVADGIPGQYEYSVAITFDDGFHDFAETAWPVLKGFGFRPIVYVPAGLIGLQECWDDCGEPPRPIMGWDTIQNLAQEGVDFGSHTISHPDLRRLERSQVDKELIQSRTIIEEKLAHPIRHFAAPYGYVTPDIQHRITCHYSTSVGTRLGTANVSNSTHNMPRLEMFYFTDINRWKAQLNGQGHGYLVKRRTMRRVRQMVRGSFRTISRKFGSIE